MLVGFNGTAKQKYGSDNNEIKSLYKKIKEKAHLSLAYTFDSVFFKQNDIAACPFIIIIDPQGIVRGITYELTYQNLLDLTNGHSVNFPKVYRTHDKENPEYGLDPFIEDFGQ